MNTFHIKYEDDQAATRAMGDNLSKIAAVEGASAHVSRSFGHGPAYIVAALPPETDPKDIFGADANINQVGEHVPPTEPVVTQPALNSEGDAHE